MYFDARSAKALAPGETMAVDGCSGLRLEAFTQWKSWIYRYRNPDGKLKQITIGRWPFMPAADAVARWRDLRDAKAAGADPGKAKREAKAIARAEALAATTVRDVVDTYVRDVLTVNWKPDSVLAARRALDRLFTESPSLARARPAEVTRAIAFDTISSRATTPTMAMRLRSLLGGAWEHATDSGRIGEDVPNWWRQILHGKLRSKGKIVKGEHQGRTHAVLTLDECGQVLRWGADNMHAHGFLVLQMYLWTGARGAEILKLQPKNITKEGDILWATLPKSQTKNAKVSRALDLRIPLMGRAGKLVEQRLAAVKAGGVMWPDSEGAAYTQKAFSTAVYDLMPDSPRGLRRGGTGWPVVGWSPHRLRATVRTLLAGLGCPRDVGEVIMGHVLPEIEGTYNRHAYDAERRLWLGRLSDQLEAASGLPPLP